MAMYILKQKWNIERQIESDQSNFPFPFLFLTSPSPSPVPVLLSARELPSDPEPDTDDLPPLSVTLKLKSTTPTRPLTALAIASRSSHTNVEHTCSAANSAYPGCSMFLGSSRSSVFMYPPPLSKLSILATRLFLVLDLETPMAVMSMSSSPVDVFIILMGGRSALEFESSDSADEPEGWR